MPRWLLGVAPLALIIVGLAAFALLDGPGLGERRGPPVEELAIEQTVLRPGVIELTVRNDGPDAVTVAQAQVNDAFVQFTGADAPIPRLDTATVRLQQPWVEGEAYEAVLVTSAGGTIAHEIPVAVETPDVDASFFGLMALLGIYVGVIPIALGMLWLPWVRSIPRTWLRVVMASRSGCSRSSPSTRRWRASSWRRRAHRRSAVRRSCSSAPSCPTCCWPACRRG